MLTAQERREEALKSEITNLRFCYDSLKEDNDNLKRQNDYLSRECEILKMKNESLQVLNRKYRQENDTITELFYRNCDETEILEHALRLHDH